MDTTLVVETCWVCGITWAMPAGWANRRSEKGEAFYCPRGDRLLYGKSENDKLREMLEVERKATGYQRELKERVERSLTATRGVLTRTRKRIGNGICPCCKRSFTNLRRHMQKLHPEYEKTEVGG